MSEAKQHVFGAIKVYEWPDGLCTASAAQEWLDGMFPSVEAGRAAADELIAGFLRAYAEQEDAQAAEITRLRDAYTRTSHEIEQTLGRALGWYPWHKDDQKNFPGATETDGVCVGEHVPETIAAEAAKEITRLREREAQAAVLIERAAAWVRECMADEGWNYIDDERLCDDLRAWLAVRA